MAKGSSEYVDGGYADRVENSKKLALRPGNHDIELRNPEGQTLFQQRVAVIVGETCATDLPTPRGHRFRVLTRAGTTQTVQVGWGKLT